MSNLEKGKVWVVIPAAGIGKRMQLDTPKQYLKINDKTVIEHTLDCFIDHPDVAGIVVALESDDCFWKTLKINYKKKPLYTVEGGKERCDSVSQTLEYLATVERIPEESWVMVHDAARPCLSRKDIDTLLAIRETESIGGILATPVRDTMKRAVSSKQVIAKTENREDLWHALTPQLFRLGTLRNALETCLEKGFEVTDESSALEALGVQPTLVEGSSSNIKITRATDLDLASWLLSQAPNAREI